MRGFRHLAGPVLAFCLFSICLAAQDIASPIPQKLTLHSSILNEDRVVWVRTPHNYDKTTAPIAVLYLADGPNHINLVGSTMDFLAEGDRMPPLIIVGIANTDRTRDMTPSHSDEKNSDGSIAYPSSGGADHFIDFIQNELMPAIERRYRVAPYKIFVGHSFGALLAVHILITRPDLCNDSMSGFNANLFQSRGATLSSPREKTVNRRREETVLRARSRNSWRDCLSFCWQKR